MNPGICYLYEYENDTKLKNVGFLKLSRHYQSCLIQIRIQNIPVKNEDTLQLYAFYNQGKDSFTKKTADISCSEKSVTARLSVSETLFPDHRILENIDGFLLEGAGAHIYAAVPENVDFNTAHIRSWEEPSQETMPLNTEIAKDTVEEEPITESGHADPNQPLVTEQELPPDETPVSVSSPLSVQKIHRSDLSSLPRKYWPLANNSFLLHGYHNYNHLLLIEEDGHRWLGVPGIYDAQEAKAAEIFGFPQFTNAYVALLDLSADECNDKAEFGHWCRYIK